MKNRHIETTIFDPTSEFLNFLYLAYLLYCCFTPVNWPNPDCSFYLPVSMFRTHTVSQICVLGNPLSSLRPSSIACNCQECDCNVSGGSRGRIPITVRPTRLHGVYKSTCRTPGFFSGVHAGQVTVSATATPHPIDLFDHLSIEEEVGDSVGKGTVRVRGQLSTLGVSLHVPETTRLRSSSG